MKIMILFKKNKKLRFGRDTCFYVITPLKKVLLNHNFGDMIHTWRGIVYHKVLMYVNMILAKNMSKGRGLSHLRCFGTKSFNSSLKLNFSSARYLLFSFY